MNRQRPLKDSEPPPARFPTFVDKAELLIKSPSRVQHLIAQAGRKLAAGGGHKISEVREQLTLAIALIRAWLSGDYRAVSTKTIVIVTAALLYFVVPLDVIPDFLFGWGFVDDVAVVGYVFSQLREELQAFRSWQNEGSESVESSTRQTNEKENRE